RKAGRTAGGCGLAGDLAGLGAGRCPLGPILHRRRRRARVGGAGREGGSGRYPNPPIDTAMMTWFVPSFRRAVRTVAPFVLPLLLLCEEPQDILTQSFNSTNIII